ncbi:transcriptional regulator, partial [Streptomyces daliensis]|nr:transcriptional regulator [Streptomyces daliensis]
MSSKRQRNSALEELLRADGWTRAGLADAVCTAATRRGVPVVCTDRHVRRWVSGEVRWPQERYLVPLQQVLGVPPEAMGFVPRSAVPTAAAPPPP